MNSGLASTRSEFTRRSELAKSPQAAESGNGPLLHSFRSKLMALVRLDKLVSLAFTRYLLAFLVGIGATLAWQSYAGAARKTVAGWSPRLAWLAPAASSQGISSERIKATSAALAAVHRSVDKLATEVGKLEEQADSDRPRRGSRRP